MSLACVLRSQMRAIVSALRPCACGTDCVPRIAGALDGRTGTQPWTAPALGGQPLVALDGDRDVGRGRGWRRDPDLRTAEKGAVLARF